MCRLLISVIEILLCGEEPVGLDEVGAAVAEPVPAALGGVGEGNIVGADFSVF